jgi:hypothetical protein
MFTNREKATEAKREIAARQWVYKNRVASGKLTQAKSDKQIALMQEIMEDYEKLAEAEEAAGRLI